MRLFVAYILASALAVGTNAFTSPHGSAFGVSTRNGGVTCRSSMRPSMDEPVPEVKKIKQFIFFDNVSFIY